MSEQTYSATGPGLLPVQIGNALPEITLSEIDGEPRARDLDVAERLGYERPRAIRQLIERNRSELERFGPLATRRGASRGQEFDGIWLTEEQALLVSALSGTDRAADVRHMLIKVFVAYRRGHLPFAAPSVVTKEVSLVFENCKRIAEIAGIAGNQSVLSAAQAARKLTGTDPLALIEATHLTAPQPEALLNPSDIGERLGGMKGHQVNTLLTAEGFQTQHRDQKDKIYYEPTPKGIEAGGVMQDTGKKSGGVPVRQLRWASRIVDVLRSILSGKAGA